MNAKLCHNKVRRAMLDKEIKQEALAEDLGISVRHVRNICYRDMDVGVSLCYNLSTIFGVTMESLLVVEEENE